MFCAVIDIYYLKIHVSYVEIYNEEIRDLLSKDNKKLEIKGNHGAVAGRSLQVCCHVTYKFNKPKTYISHVVRTS